MTARDPYRSPLHYDLEYDGQVEDVRWYTAVCARLQGPVLELGCGNGRITLPLARAGHTVHGLDLNLAMLDDLRRKLEQESAAVQRRVQLRQGNFLDLPGPPTFGTVLLPFNAIHHCDDHRDVLRLFEGVRRSLRPGGVFALDMYRPYPELYARDATQRYGERTDTDPRTGLPIESWEQSDYDADRQIHRVRYTYVHADGTRHEVDLNLRVFYPRELLALLDWAGFDIVEQYADFERRPVTADATKWVLLLKPR